MAKRPEGAPKGTVYPKVQAPLRRGDTPLRDKREQAAKVPSTRQAHVRANTARRVPAVPGPDRLPLGGADALALSVVERTLHGSLKTASVNIALPQVKHLTKHRPPAVYAIVTLDNALRLPTDLAAHGRRLAVRSLGSYRQLPVPLAGMDKTLQEIFRRTLSAALRPFEPLATEIVTAFMPSSIDRSATDTAPSDDGFLLAEKSRGQVVDVSEDDGTFTADIDELDSTGESVRVDLPLKDVQSGDADLVRPGATFDISIGTAASPIAFKTQFHRLRTTPESIEAGRALVASLSDRFDVSELAVDPGDGKSRPSKAAPTGRRRARTST